MGLLVLSTLLFSFSIGYHYAGAVVGTAYGGKVVGLRKGLLVAAGLILVGTLITPVSQTYNRLYAGSYEGYSAILLGAFIATSVATYLKIPTSTIQIFAFSALAPAFVGDGNINLRVLLILMCSWGLAPTLSYIVAPLIRRITPDTGGLLWLTMCLSALAVGTNDVGMSAAFLGEKGLSEYYAKLLAGVSAAIGMVAWGSKLAKLVGDELGLQDRRSFVAAQSTKIGVLLILNSVGLNASMNQTLIGALARLGAKRSVIRNIVIGWLFSPVLGVVLTLLVYQLLRILRH